MTEHDAVYPHSSQVLIPTSVADLDLFVAALIDEFKLPEGDDTYDAIATMILHLPGTVAYKEMSYFGHGVLKSMANKAAYTKLQEFAAKRKAKEEAEDAVKKAELTSVPKDQVSADGGEPLQDS